MIKQYTTNNLNFKQTNTALTNNKQNCEKQKDIYADTPIRLLGFTNEVGAALSPIIGPVGELLTYVPALSYIAMDTKDKYHRGEDNDYKKPSGKRAAKQLIFQMMASVIFPTAAVKASQAIANKIIDSKPLEATRNNLAKKIEKNTSLNSFLKKFEDKQHNNNQEKALTKFAHKFEKVLNTITVAPLLFKPKQNKSGLRNLGLAAVGLTTLGMVIKPIDKVSEHLVHSFVKPVLDKN